ncbi:hypothetical protein [Halorhodospira neutriphila]|uniref:Uncharacterized protein n=1 Tax=Halorhodospira neutriphila TaxID=168379 RepID=A0ABS1E8S9_9GAMM|nr:hypothetical protein [Halorhodospira neutriphila]MBK1726806.1 hypothetical protein [Halorhodospira neutriphila]
MSKAKRIAVEARRLLEDEAPTVDAAAGALVAEADALLVRGAGPGRRPAMVGSLDWRVQRHGRR